MKLKTTYSKQPDGWAFTIANGITRTVSTGYRTKAQAREVAREIIQMVKDDNRKP